MKDGYAHLTTVEKLLLGFLYACIVVGWVVLVLGVYAFTSMLRDGSPNVFDAVPLILGGLVGIVLLALALTQFKQLEVLRRINDAASPEAEDQAPVIKQLNNISVLLAAILKGQNNAGDVSTQLERLDKVSELLEETAKGIPAEEIAGQSNRFSKMLTGLESMRTQIDSANGEKIEQLDRIVDQLQALREDTDALSKAMPDSERVDRILETLENLPEQGVDGTTDTATSQRHEQLMTYIEAQVTNPSPPPDSERLDKILAMLDNTNSDDRTKDTDEKLNTIVSLLENVQASVIADNDHAPELERLEMIVEKLDKKTDVDRLDEILEVLTSNDSGDRTTADEKLDTIVSLLEDVQLSILVDQDKATQSQRLEATEETLDEAPSREMLKSGDENSARIFFAARIASRPHRGGRQQHEIGGATRRHKPFS